MHLDGAKLKQVCETHGIQSSQIHSSVRLKINYSTFTEKCARIKQKVKLRAVTSETCEQKYKFYGNEQVINHGRVCAGGDEAYDTCAGKL